MDNESQIIERHARLKALLPNLLWERDQRLERWVGGTPADNVVTVTDDDVVYAWTPEQGSGHPDALYCRCYDDEDALFRALTKWRDATYGPRPAPFVCSECGAEYPIGTSFQKDIFCSPIDRKVRCGSCAATHALGYAVFEIARLQYEAIEDSPIVKEARAYTEFDDSVWEKIDRLSKAEVIQMSAIKQNHLVALRDAVRKNR